MDVYQIIITHNRPWTMREMICGVVLNIVLIILMSIGVKKRVLRLSQAVAFVLLSLYLETVFASTVFTRMPGLGYQYKMELFWSWKEVWLHGDDALLQENLLNLILLFPMGLLLPVVLERKRGNFLLGFLSGAAISAVIEVCQLVFCRGLFEWDDMVHNGIGCMIGYMITDVIMKMKKDGNFLD